MNKIYWLSLFSIIFILIICIKTYMKLSIFSYNKPLVYEPLKIYNNITDSSFWIDKDKLHGFNKNQLIDNIIPICNNFFVLWYIYLYIFQY